MQKNRKEDVFMPIKLPPFNGDFINSKGQLQNLMETGSRELSNGMSPFSGDFIASDGTIHNIDELLMGSTGGGSADLSNYYTKGEVEELMASNVQKLIVLNNIVSLNPNEIKLITIPCGCKTYLLKTISFDTNKTCIAKIYENDTGIKPVYTSNESTNIYDIVDIPIVDELSTESTGNVYLELINTSTMAIDVDYTIKILSLY